MKEFIVEALAIVARAIWQGVAEVSTVEGFGSAALLTTVVVALTFVAGIVASTFGTDDATAPILTEAERTQS